jgi:energy-converting hydrogenase B subunit G
MGLYDRLINSFTNLKENISNDAYTSESVSSALAAELTLISTLLLLVFMIRKVSLALAIIVVIILSVLLVTNMPLIPKLKREQGDSLEKMLFYVIIALGILITIIYWGTTNV